MIHPGAAGERFIAVGGPATSFSEMARILARHLPALAGRLPGVELTDEQTREGARTDPAVREGQDAARQARCPPSAATSAGGRPR
ncbi:hypothetical protein [Herbidospora cretacea]|uniref:hypothetical protein n=1 Tax=Herbidospora cretacea TaxID=28444 RepID=UPI0004C2ED59|nr:hypothetical protein [Herbidospora cretacea]